MYVKKILEYVTYQKAQFFAPHLTLKLTFYVSFYVPFVCTICMYHLYVPFVCNICMYHLHLPFLYTIFNVPFFKLEESSEATL